MSLKPASRLSSAAHVGSASSLVLGAAGVSDDHSSVSGTHTPVKSRVNRVKTAGGGRKQSVSDAPVVKTPPHGTSGGGGGGGGSGNTVVSGAVIAALEKRAQEAESERDQLLFNLTQVQLEARNEVEFLQKEIEEGNNKRNQMQAKVDRVDKIENAIISLYIEMKDNSSHVNKDAARVAAEEREALKAQNPIVVLDKLRANLTNLLLFKADFENELKDRMNRKKSDLEIKVEALNSKVAEMSSYNETAKAKTENAEKRRKQAEAEYKNILATSDERRTATQKNIDDLTNALKLKEDEVVALKAELAAKDLELRHKEIKIMRIQALESQIQANKIQHQVDLQKIQSQHIQSLKVFEKEIAKFTKSEAEKAAYLEIAENAKSAIEGYRRNIMVQQQESTENRIERLEKIIQERDDKIKDLEVKLRHSQYNVQEVSEKQKVLKKEYEKLFQQISRRVKMSKEDKTKVQTAEDIHAQAEMNPQYVSVYKARLKTKEREVQELNDKIRRLLAVEHKNKVMRKSFEVERARYQHELNEARSRHAGFKSSFAATQLGSQGSNSNNSNNNNNTNGSAGGGGAGGAGDGMSAASRYTRPTTAGGRIGGAGGGGAIGSGSAIITHGNEELNELKKENDHMREVLKDYQQIKSMVLDTNTTYDTMLQRSSFSSSFAVDPATPRDSSGGPAVSFSTADMSTSGANATMVRPATAPADAPVPRGGRSLRPGNLGSSSSDLRPQPPK